MTVIPATGSCLAKPNNPKTKRRMEGGKVLFVCFCKKKKDTHTNFTKNRNFFFVLLQLRNFVLKCARNTKKYKKKKKIQEVHFDERVVVHTVPHWDPSRTQSFAGNDYPQETGTTCACCVVA